MDERIGNWVQDDCLSLKDAIDEVRCELASQRTVGTLSPTSVRWALEHLAQLGATLEQLLGVAFDFAESTWLPEVMGTRSEPDISFDFGGLAEQLGLDPATGRPLKPPAAKTKPGPLRLVSLEAAVDSAAPPRPERPLSRQGLRQKPLTGWTGARCKHI